jgi:outer membrane receptor protein involved in Fe transport
MRPLVGLFAAMMVVATAARARAQALPEVPVLVYEEELGETEGSEDELDLANLVTSAAKTVTTVQEAPAIITIIPTEELQDRQQRTLLEIGDLVPGFLRFDQFKDLYPQLTTRGVPQAMLYLHDGFSMFDPMLNANSLHRGTPLETIKRIEIISGPGGVLWGANSFLGVMNVITKDAEDIDGVQANFSIADGKGDRQSMRGYVMAGWPGIFGDPDNGLVLHTSFENYTGVIRTRSQHMFSTPLPQPNSWFLYGPVIDSNPPPSQIFNFDGKLSLGRLTLQWSVPWMKRYAGVTFNEPVPQQHLADDVLPECSPLDPTDPMVGAPGDRCLDRGHAARYSIVNSYERYALAEWKNRFSATSGVSIKSYLIQFVRGFDRLVVLPPVAGLLQGGLAFEADFDTYRAGGNLDGDFALTEKLRMLYGFEAFHEWLPDDTEQSRQGPGSEATFFGPSHFKSVPFPCPLTGTWNDTNQTVENVRNVPSCPMTMIFQVSRTTIGGFTDLQLRPNPRLILDGGVRLQAAPALTSTARGYGLQPTLSGAAVYEFVPDWHLKLNYAEGFRPPVYNNTDSNGEAVEIDGDEDLRVEKSQSGQVEVNARLLKGRRRIRELDLRADYSYTVLDGYIAFVAGRYANTAKRGIHSAELLAKLYISGGHRFELGYTFNKMDTDDKGTFGSMPNNWFNLTSINPIVQDRFELATVLHIYGAFEDPNRRVEARNLSAGVDGVPNPMDSMEVIRVFPTDTVMDRAPPSADLQVGARLHLADDKMLIQATVYNAFNVERYQYDPSNDLEPRLDITPNNFEAFRFYVSGTYKF